MDNKPKVFVRYPLGASGNFISLLLLSMVTPVKLREKHRAHKNAYQVFQYNNLIEQWGVHSKDFAQYTFSNTPDIDITSELLEVATTWMTDTFKFYETPLPIHVANTHARNPDALLSAFTNTKLINIVVDDDDVSQIAYNYIYKVASYMSKNQLIVDSFINSIRDRHQKKLLEVDLNSKDVRLLTYLYIFSYGETGIPGFNNCTYKSNGFNLKFKDIASTRIINQLDAIAEYMGITLTDERRQNAISIINEYAGGQKIVPWNFSLNDYD